MDTHYRGNNSQQRNQHHQNFQNGAQLNPVEPIPRLQYNEIGIRGTIKGRQIKFLIDKITNYLLYRRYSSVILKARGKGISKLISIVDILKNKILGLYHIPKTYSTTYTTVNDNKEVKLPCMNVELLLHEPQDKFCGFVPPKKKEEMEPGFLDPNHLPGNHQHGYQRNFHPGFRGGRGHSRGRGGMRGNFRGRGNLRGRGGFRGGRGTPFRGRGGYNTSRGRGGFTENASRGRNYNNSQGYNNNRNYNDNYFQERRNYQENDYSGSRNAPYRGRNERGSRGGRAMRPRGRGY